MTDIACPQAEAAYLGALLLGAPNTRSLAALVNVDDLYDPRHRLVLTAVQAVLAADTTPDPITTLGELRRTGNERSFLDDKAAAVFLADLAHNCPVVASARHYANVILEHAARRRVAETAERLAQAAGRSSLDDLRLLLAEEWLTLSASLRRAGQPGIAPVEVAA